MAALPLLAGIIAVTLAGWAGMRADRRTRAIDARKRQRQLSGSIDGS